MQVHQGIVNGLLRVGFVIRVSATPDAFGAAIPTITDGAEYTRIPAKPKDATAPNPPKTQWPRPVETASPCEVVDADNVGNRRTLEYILDSNGEPSELKRVLRI
jgi:hypothetical protein